MVVIHLLKNKKFDGESYHLLDQLDGGACDANMCSYYDGINMNIEDEENVYPISAAGNRFYFVACVPSYHYITKVISELIILC